MHDPCDRLSSHLLAPSALPRYITPRPHWPIPIFLPQPLFLYSHRAICQPQSQDSRLGHERIRYGPGDQVGVKISAAVSHAVTILVSIICGDHHKPSWVRAAALCHCVAQETDGRTQAMSMWVQNTKPTMRSCASSSRVERVDKL